MNDKEILILVGGHSSGKTTAAYSLADEDNRYVVVERESVISPNKTEQKIGRDFNNKVRDVLDSGRSVIASDICFNQAALTALGRIAFEYDIPVTYDRLFLQVPLSERLVRDSLRLNPRGEKALLQEFYTHIYPKEASRHPDWVADNPRAVVFGLDNVLSTPTRDEFSPNHTKTDIANTSVALLIDLLETYRVSPIQQITGYVKTIIVTEREEKYRQQTTDWLDAQCIEYDELIMKRSNDTSSEIKFKKEVYNDYLKNKYDVILWIDNRAAVVNMLRRDLMLPVLQIGDTFDYKR